MNNAQRRILKGALVTIVISLIFPPMATYHSMGGIISWDGFGFLLSSPRRSVIMVSMLFAEWIAIGIIASILWALARTGESAFDRLVSAIKKDAATQRGWQ